MPQHHFPEDSDTCANCGAAAFDAAQVSIGCEAEDIVNPRDYLGLALTPTESSLDITSEEKTDFLYPAGVAHDWTTRWEAWRSEVESRLAS